MNVSIEFPDFEQTITITLIVALVQTVDKGVSDVAGKHMICKLM